MTYREKLQQEHPELVDDFFCGGCSGCPSFYDYVKSKDCPDTSCAECWNREMPTDEVTV